MRVEAGVLVRTAEDTPCFLQLTSGTTGRPKAWVKTYRSWQAVINHNSSRPSRRDSGG